MSTNNNSRYKLNQQKNLKIFSNKSNYHKYNHQKYQITLKILKNSHNLNQINLKIFNKYNNPSKFNKMKSLKIYSNKQKNLRFCNSNNNSHKHHKYQKNLRIFYKAAEYNNNFSK